MLLTILIAAGATAHADAPAFPNFFEKINLSRTYKADHTDAFRIKFTITPNGMDSAQAQADAELTNKVTKVRDSGGAEIEQKISKFTMKQEGKDVGAPTPPMRLQDFDKYGLPTSVTVQDGGVIYLLAAVPGYVPGTELSVGDSFDIKWTSANKTFALEGKGTLQEIVTLDGQKAAKIKTRVVGRPEGDSPGTIEYVSYIELSTGELLKCEGSILLEDQMGRFEISRLK